MAKRTKRIDWAKGSEGTEGTKATQLPLITGVPKKTMVLKVTIDGALHYDLKMISLVNRTTMAKLVPYLLRHALDSLSERKEDVKPS